MELKVLIIEDSSIVAMHIERTVEYYGHQAVAVVGSSEEALAAAKKHKLDLVLSDIDIEGEMNGIDTCKILQKKYRLPVILISAFNDLPTLKNASTLDFIGYLIKPFREDELKTLLDLTVLRAEDNDMTHKREIIDHRYSYCPQHQTLYRYEEVIDLSQKEHSFLVALLGAKGAIVSYSSFAHAIWEDEDINDDTRRQLVYRFRQKIPDFPLKSLKGIGYKLEKQKENK